MVANGRWLWSYAVICPHPQRAQVLLVRADTGLTLPCWRGVEPRAWQDASAVTATIRERFGVEAVALRCVRHHRDAVDQRTDLWYELDTLAMPSTVPEGRWYGREALDAVADTAQRTHLEQWFREEDEGIPTLRRPWARRGWFAQARLWIVEQCARLGLSVRGPVVQIRTWRRCCLLIIPTSMGLLYFKALPPASAHEIALLGFLAQHTPDRIVHVVATHPDQAWLLMADVCGAPLDEAREITQWEYSVRAYAALQVTMASQHEALLSRGCPDHRPHQLSSQIVPFVAGLADDPKVSSLNKRRLEALLPQFTRRCTDLATATVPASLEHGDLWPANVAWTKRGPIFFDWSESSVAHPFFSMYFFLRPEGWPEPLQRSAEAGARLRAAYLEPWTEFGTPAYVAEVFTHAQALAPLHHAMLAQHRFLSEIEETWEKDVARAFVAMLLARWPEEGTLSSHPPDVRSS